MALVKRQGVADETGLSIGDLVELEQLDIVKPIYIGKDVYYTEAHRRRIDVVLKGRKLGFSSREIKAIIENAILRNRRANGSS